MLRDNGYDVEYRGKWHLSKGPDGGEDVTARGPRGVRVRRLGRAGLRRRHAPENFGGGRADHDANYIEQALAFLRERAASGNPTPFCLVLSLVNPHDVLAFPRDWVDDYRPDGPGGRRRAAPASTRTLRPTTSRPPTR